MLTKTCVSQGFCVLAGYLSFCKINCKFVIVRFVCVAILQRVGHPVTGILVLGHRCCWYIYWGQVHIDMLQGRVGSIVLIHFKMSYYTHSHMNLFIMVTGSVMFVIIRWWQYLMVIMCYNWCAYDRLSMCSLCLMSSLYVPLKYETCLLSQVGVSKRKH